MSEQISVRNQIRNSVTAACASGALILAGCGVGEAKGKDATLERCYDAPQPDRNNQILPEPEPITLHYDRGHFEEETYADTLINLKLEAANIAITADGRHGSGFLTLASDGTVVGITAAHVTDGVALKDIEVQDHQGNVSDVIGGCYMYERNGEFVDGDAPGVQEVDVAVLRLSTRLGGDVLKLSATAPKRGEWVTFVNNQIYQDARSPTSYNGLVTNWAPNGRGNSVLTGLQPWKKLASGTVSYSTEKGGSGGIVADQQTGEVEALLAGGPLGTYDSAESTAAYFGVHFTAPVGNETGIVPSEALVIDAEAIRSALGGKY